MHKLLLAGTAAIAFVFSVPAFATATNSFAAFQGDTMQRDGQHDDRRTGPYINDSAPYHQIYTGRSVSRGTQHTAR